MLELLITILKFILLGFLLGACINTLYMIFKVYRYRVKELEKLKLPEYSDVVVENIYFESPSENITYLKKISFGSGRIYLGYQMISEDVVYPIVCMAIKEKGERKGMALWLSKAVSNDLNSTLQTLEKIEKGIVDDLLKKESPVYDRILEEIYRRNGL